ncbi:MAG: M28 family peptidase [Bacteroidales bacterium]|nr:M28 family peptidase [Bacteroidales bacterium]
MLSVLGLLSGSFNVVRSQDTAYVRRVIRDLASPDMYGRGMQHRGDSIAAAYVRNELIDMGVKPLCKDYYQYFRFPNTTSRPPIVRAGYRSQNVCGYIPGETDSMIVFTAHYEHLGMHGDTIFFGAHDNASGTAAVLDLARTLSKVQTDAGALRYTYVFLFFGGEEAGLIGSGFFADMPLIKMNKVKLLINIDLFCGGEEGLMVVNANARETAPYVDLLQQLNEHELNASGLSATVAGQSGYHSYAAKIGRRDNAPNSDHYYLSQLCPAIFIYTLGGPYGGYHSPTDTCDSCGLDHYPRFLTLLLSFLQHL